MNVAQYLRVFSRAKHNSIIRFRIKDTQKFSSDIIKGTKNSIFSLSQDPTHHSFNFNLRFSYELEYKVRLSKYVCGIFHFQCRFVFIKIYIFVQ